VSISAIVQARASSARLPGKVLLEVGGKPMIGYVVERLMHARSVDEVIVATSDDPSDDPVADLCADLHVSCHRGSLDDVAGRMLHAAEAAGHDAFVRVSGDSPLLDQALVDQCVGLLDGDCDVATNIQPRTFPHGQSVEAIRVDAFRRAYDSMRDAGDLEHVTPFLYRHPSEFRLASFTRAPDISDVQLSVDTRSDLDLFTAIVGAMERPHWTYDLDAILAIRDACLS
jgi:spore coat polysaccharide biosynthesis protein SpsF